MTTTTASVAFLLHMHQPLYVDPTTRRAELPWVMLHGGSAYLDVATLLDEHPNMRLTVNFVPSLLAQLEEVVAGARDAWLELAERPIGELRPDERTALIARLFSINWQRAVEPRPRYRELLDKRGRAPRPEELAARAAAFTDEELRDLTVLFWLGWLGFAARRGDSEIAALEAKGRAYGDEDLRLVVDRHRRACARVVPLWKKLAARGQVELSSSPYYHPIIPLLCDTDTARRAQPQLPLPTVALRAPEDARAHVARGIATHQRVFGVKPRGMWPPEGSVSPEALAVYADAGIEWLATDEGNLWRSLAASGVGAPARGDLYRAWRTAGVDVLFRDREMSDRIGFAYALGDARPAVEDLLGRARHAASQSTAPAGAAVVPIFLDGENAWAAYPGQGEPFLRELFSSLSRDAGLRPTTIAEALAASPARATLGTIHSGSWIDSDFHIWIGDPVKNRAWALLADVRRRVVEAKASGRVDAAAMAEAEEHLLAAEGSDWFWWFGEPFSSAEDAIFDRLFRAHLIGALQAIGAPEDPALSAPVDPERRLPPSLEALSTHAPFALIRPRIEEGEGRPTAFYAWHGAGRYEPPRGAAMAESALVERIRFGFDHTQLFVRVEAAAARVAELEGAMVELEVSAAAGGRRRLRVVGGVDGNARWELLVEESGGWVDHGDGRPAVFRRRHGVLEAVELGVPFARLELAPGTQVGLVVRVVDEGGVVLGRYPSTGTLAFNVPDEGFEADHWSA